MNMTISADYLANHLNEVLNHIQKQHLAIAIERDGQIVATIVPSGSETGVTWPDLVRLWKSFPKEDDDSFADDLEAVRNAQSQLRVPEWRP